MAPSPDALHCYLEEQLDEQEEPEGASTVATQYSQPFGAFASDSGEAVALDQKFRRSLVGPISGSSFRAVSLNLGGCHANPLAYELKGDGSEMAVQTAAILGRAKKALREESEGPLALPDEERQLIVEMLAEIYGGEMPELRAETESLLDCKTWAKVVSRVKAHQPNLFHALNSHTLRLKRPSVWENPASCLGLTDTLAYLYTWQDWYRCLDRTTDFWREEVPRILQESSLETATGFAGLLIFDVMSMCSARSAFGNASDYDISDDEDRAIPFREINRFASEQPLSNLGASCSLAAQFIQHMQADVVFLQAKAHNSNLTIDEFLPPFSSPDKGSAVLLREGVFGDTTNISTPVLTRVLDLMDAAGVGSGKLPHCMASSLAAVYCRYDTTRGSFKVCFVSLQVSQSETVAAFVEILRDVLDKYEADIHVIGMASDCSAKDTVALQRDLRQSGFDIGPQQDQVTVVTQRTSFQTQALKAGEVDCSHKDYLLSWGSSRFRRLETIYTPDVRTAYGIEQETRQGVRLPTNQWPFENCSVAASFKLRRRCRSLKLLQARKLCSCALVLFVVFIILTPLGSSQRLSPFGAPGTWHPSGWPGQLRVGMCEAQAPCKEDWIANEGSCYKATPKMVYDDADLYCQNRNGTLVSIGSEVENQFLAHHLCPQGDFCWIGLRSDASREQFSWMSGEPVNFTRLVGAQPGFFPILPNSRDTGSEAAVLSAWPEEISGCVVSELFVPLDEAPLALIGFRLAGPAVVLFTSAVLLVCPRPGQHRVHRTTLFLWVSFLFNLGFYVFSVQSSCFATDIETVGFAYGMMMVLESEKNVLSTWWGFLIILRRMSHLYPVHTSWLAYVLICIVWSLWGWTHIVSVDTSTTLSATSISVWLLISAMSTIILLYIVFGVPIVSQSYRTWILMQREATTGCSQHRRSKMGHQVRAAQMHCIAVLAAIGTGALRWSAALAWTFEAMRPGFVFWTRYATVLTNSADTMTNDLCAHLLAVLNMDETIVRAKGISTEVARRASLEVKQHQLAVRLLKAAPTSEEQLQEFAELEVQARASIDSEDKTPFLILKSAITVESLRIHKLMRCVRVRAMTMPLRYSYLMEIPAVTKTPRQHVPARFAGAESDEAATEYLDWLLEEADGAQRVLFQQVNQLLASFNKTPWPTDLGLVSEQFPWTIWADGPVRKSSSRVQKSEDINPGDIMLHRPAWKAPCCFGGRSWVHCFVQEGSGGRVSIHRSGAVAPQEVAREELRKCGGGAVFVPGPKKKRHRCLDKISTDYDGKEPWPAAASVCDICRCSILLDDPYAIAVLVAYISSKMRVVRLKNRFSEDVLECFSPEELQAMFQTDNSDNMSRISTVDRSGDRQYRDIMMSVEIMSPTGTPFICEIQVTLSNLAILKKADTKLYTIRRMQSPQELRAAYVFASPILSSDTAPVPAG